MSSKDKESDVLSHPETIEEGEEEETKSRYQRSRTLTAKGLTYQMDVKDKRRHQALRQLQAKTELIRSLFIEHTTTHEKELLFSHWLTLYEHFLDACEEYSILLSTEDQDSDRHNWLEPYSIQFQAFKESVQTWISDIINQSDYKETASIHSRQSSQKSQGSHASSMGSMLSTVRFKEEQKKAELVIKAAALKKKRDIEQAKLRLKFEEEELEIESQMAISASKTDVVNQFESMIQSTHVPDSNAITARTHEQISPHRLDARAGTFVPVKQVTTSSDIAAHDHKRINREITHKEDHADALVSNNTSSEEVLMAVVRHLRKPASDIKKFDGNPLEYKKFMRQFRSKIVNNTDDNDERLNFLEQYTVGEAHKIVAGLSYLEADVGYSAALRELDERYGDPEVIVSAFLKKALSWPAIKANNAKALDEYGMFLVECQNAIKCMDAMTFLEYSENYKKMVSKLPFHLHDKWRAVVFRTKERGQTVKFHQLVEFVKAEAKKANDATFGRDALEPQKDIDKKYSTVQRPTGIKASFASNTMNNHHTKNNTIDARDTNFKYTEKSYRYNPTKSERSRVAAVKSHEESRCAFTKPCIYCNDALHSMNDCQRLSTLVFGERIAFLKGQGLCFGCLKLGHFRDQCRCKAICQKCQNRHPTVLHFSWSPHDNIVKKTAASDSVSGRDDDDQPAHTSTKRMECHTGAGEDESTMAIIPVTLKSRNGMRTVRTYAFLDPGSNISFCSEEIARKLGVSGRRMKITMQTMGVTQRLNTHMIDGLEIAGLDSDDYIQLPHMYTKEKMPVSRSHIPTSADISQWSHLDGVHLPEIDEEVGILIGNNVPDVYTPLELKTGPRGSPHAARTLLGWIVWNVIRNNSSHDFCVNRSEIVAIQQMEDLKQLSQIYQRSINIDFPERTIDDKREPSQEDKMFMDLVQKSIVMREGHYELCLPFRDNVLLPDNQLQALQRLKSLQKKMTKNSKFCSDYKQFMQTIIDKGYAELVSEDELVRVDGKVWYLPHHGIYHPKKPEKIRVVFDCAATYKGMSLNHVLLQGPDLTNNLMGVLLRFRQDPVAIMADIEAMFHQVRVPKDDQDCLRFYWWPNGNLDSEPKVYRMVVHLFGAVSSPSCCNLALRQVATHHQTEFTRASNSIMRNFYVDDFLTSLTTEDEAISLMHDMRVLCQKGGFRLTKWVSNSRNVIASIPEEDRTKGLRDISFDKLPTERALGVYWDIESDCLGFNIMVKNPAPTRRNILSVVCSIYDPFGLAAPFMLPAKILLQDLCRTNMEWDAELTGGDLRTWQQWLFSLPKLEKLTVQRCLKPANFGQVISTQLHYFADASDHGYGIVAYIRFSNNRDMFHCQLLLSKARVAPLKRATIPRMELTAATIAVKMHRKLQEELSIHIDDVYFWTDSMAVLRYIANEKTRFHTFVANRVTIIREGSTIRQWRYIESKSNPADIVSRGVVVDDLLQAQWWIKGPEFLWQPASEWMQDTPHSLLLHDDDPEVKRVVHATNILCSEDYPLDGLLQRISTWNRLKRVIGWIVLYLERLKLLVSKRKKLKSQLSCNEQNSAKLNRVVDEEVTKHRLSVQQLSDNISTISLENAILDKSEKIICRHVQNQHYLKEINDLHSENIGRVKKESSISKLDPFISEGLLRVGGRLGQSSMPYNARHPVILPRDSQLSKLILENTHIEVGHMGRNSMLSLLRQHYWIVGASSIIRKLLARCIICRKYRAQTVEQKMADLPVDRITPDEKPFSRVGVDYFGPFQIKRGRSLVKRYGIIFTCLTSRAVHLEVGHALDTDSCINAVRRFIARRGPMKVIYSDNGTNLVGAERELREEVNNWNKSKMKEAFCLQKITWKFNPPAASHFGGVWERLIRMVRKILYSLLHQQSHHLDDEGLQTLFCEIEAIMNNRPLTIVSSDPNDLEALTPNHLLLLRPGENLPCGLFNKSDNYPRRRWRQIQYLADVFWVRWVKEYLPTLQARQKWVKSHRNISVGDVVMVVDNSPRNSWVLGRVLDVMKDRKGFVRIVQVKTSTTVLQRPVHKLCLVLEADLNDDT